LDLDPTPDAWKAFERQARRQNLYCALGAIVEAVGVAAAWKPKSIGKLVVSTFETVGERHDYLKAALVECLGWMAREASALPIIVPPFYQAMMSGSTLVRAAAARAYAKLAKHCAEDLPPLVHESFLILLTDPDVAVHSAPVDALREVDLPEPFTTRVVTCLLYLISRYSRSRSDDDILSKSIQRYLDLVGKDLPSRTPDAIVSILDGMAVSAATDVILQSGFALRGASRLGELLIKLISDPETNEYYVDDLLGELEEVSPKQILGVSDRFKAAARSCTSRGIEVADEMIAILTAVGAWAEAADVARDATERLSDDAWDRPRKLRSTARQVAAELELAAASSDTARVAELAARWRESKQEAERDNEENREKRSPILGLRIPHSSN